MFDTIIHVLHPSLLITMFINMSLAAIVIHYLFKFVFSRHLGGARSYFLAIAGTMITFVPSDSSVVDWDNMSKNRLEFNLACISALLLVLFYEYSRTRYGNRKKNR